MGDQHLDISLVNSWVRGGAISNTRHQLLHATTLTNLNIAHLPTRLPAPEKSQLDVPTAPSGLSVWAARVLVTAASPKQAFFRAPADGRYSALAARALCMSDLLQQVVANNLATWCRPQVDGQGQPRYFQVRTIQGVLAEVAGCGVSRLHDAALARGAHVVRESAVKIREKQYFTATAAGPLPLQRRSHLQWTHDAQRCHFWFAWCSVTTGCTDQERIRESSCSGCSPFLVRNRLCRGNTKRRCPFFGRVQSQSRDQSRRHTSSQSQDHCSAPGPRCSCCSGRRPARHCSTIIPGSCQSWPSAWFTQLAQHMACKPKASRAAQSTLLLLTDTHLVALGARVLEQRRRPDEPEASRGGIGARAQGDRLS